MLREQFDSQISEVANGQHAMQVREFVSGGDEQANAANLNSRFLFAPRGIDLPPLHYAALASSPSVVQQLLLSRADASSSPSSAGGYYKNAMYYACHGERSRLQLLRRSAGIVAAVLDLLAGQVRQA